MHPQQITLLFQSSCGRLDIQELHSIITDNRLYYVTVLFFISNNTTLIHIMLKGDNVQFK